MNLNQLQNNNQQNNNQYSQQDNQLVFTQLKTQIESNINLNQTKFKSEEQKQAYEQKLYLKVRAGKKLTSREMNYLQMHNPTLYMEARLIQSKREMVENRLKSCKSKEEVIRVIGDEMSRINKDTPLKEAMINAVNEAAKEFQKTDQYKSLPRTEKEAKQENCKTKDKINLEGLAEENQSDLTFDYNSTLGQYQEAFLEVDSINLKFDTKF